MDCPKCKGLSKVVNTFYEEKTYRKVRQRDCTECGNRYFTIQDPETILLPKTFKLPNRVQKNKMVITNLSPVC